MKELFDYVLSGGQISAEQAMGLVTAPLKELCEAANAIRFAYCGDSFTFCTIVNGKGGRCSENCRYCAQSAQYPAKVEEYPLYDAPKMAEEIDNHAWEKVSRCGVVTAGRTLNDREVETLCEGYRLTKDKTHIGLCASAGLLGEQALEQLKAAGVTRYHNNLESSARYFPQVCTSHSQLVKIDTLKAAQKIGMSVCSGGIVGMGESWQDRIDLACQLRELGVNSVPLNLLNPIPGTPFAGLSPLSNEEFCRIVAIFRFLLPGTRLRLAGGRGLLPDRGRQAFMSGANAAITGDMLTTAGVGVKEDIRLVTSFGFEVVSE